MNSNIIFKSNKVKLLLIITLALNIMLMGVLVYQLNMKKKEIYTIKATTQNSSTNVFGFENAQELLKITINNNEINSGEISKNIETFATETIPFIYNGMINGSIEKLYEDNKKFLKENVGIQSKDELINFCKNLSNSGCNFKYIGAAEYISNSIEYDGYNLKVCFKLKDKEKNSITVKLTYSSIYEIKYKYEIVE